jgi:glucose-6-phosphate 1-dehydrogenase
MVDDFGWLTLAREPQGNAGEKNAMANQVPPDQIPMTVVIFGASGDLTNRKLIPALFNLCRKNKLPANTNIVGVSRSPYSHEAFRDHLREGAQQFTEGAFLAEDWADFARRIWYVSGDSSKPEDFADLQSFLGQLERRAANRLYYLAVAPTLYQPIVANLSAVGMADQGENGIGWRRVVIEKPFGTDLPSARALNRALHNVFDESYIYRIDHYLGKETAQNILFLRFANTIFEPIWNRTYVDHMQITVAESVAVGSQTGFTTVRAFCGICSRITCCNCSRWWRWSRRHRSKRMRCATRKSKC